MRIKVTQVVRKKTSLCVSVYCDIASTHKLPRVVALDRALPRMNRPPGRERRSN
jgi:hypothetical protein